MVIKHYLYTQNSGHVLFNSSRMDIRPRPGESIGFGKLREHLRRTNKYFYEEVTPRGSGLWMKPKLTLGDNGWFLLKLVSAGKDDAVSNAFFCDSLQEMIAGRPGA